MRTLLIMAAMLLSFTVLADENGCDDDCNGGGDTYNTTNKGGKGGTGVGIGIGIGKGGSAYSKAYGGNAKAYGGNAYSKGGSAYQGQDQDQGQGQGQKQGMQYNGNVTVEGDSVLVEDKYQAPGIVAPGIDTSQVNVECPLYVQDGWSAGASGPGAGLTAGATDAEAIPTCFALLAAKNSTGTAKTLAGTAFYCLSFEAAGVDNSECKGWRDSVRGGPAPTVRDVSVREGR